ncbi:uncharacterized protein, partial [Primulina huaijiensis]|uniref:uncharacterized protein n=1 Tax=Primulina huaijiensis TaxID=1492673 RepID=UPI003CC71D75
MWMQQNSSGVSIYQFNFFEPRISRGASKFQFPLYPIPLEATTWKSSAHKTTAVCRRIPLNYMDDVDRLFQCFKCGITPPESAIRERRKEKRKLKQQFSPRQEASPSTHTQTAKICVESRNISKQFSPIVFYGSPHAVPPKRPVHLLRLLHEIRADLDGQNKLREEIWKTFPRQDEAMKFAKQHANARVFSYQDHVNGVRRFLVSKYKEFWQRYKGMSPQFRHHYEVIQE